MKVFQRMRSISVHGQSIDGKKRTMRDKKVRRPTVLVVADGEFDVSGRTVDVDLSIRSLDSAYDLYTRPHAKVIGDTSCLAGPQLKGCMKATTQRDSLAMITQLKLPTPAPTIIETAEKVRFDSVEFREYHRALSDNPSTSAGPPIGISWTYDPKETIVFDLDLYESNREGYQRSKWAFAIPPGVREDMLREAGYSRNEIKLAARRAKKGKQQRIASVQQQKFDPLLERVDSMKHRVKRIMPSMK